VGLTTFSASSHRLEAKLFIGLDSGGESSPRLFQLVGSSTVLEDEVSLSFLAVDLGVKLL
jgi:hypothetical protein